MNRAEHLQWCKDRAIELLDSGDLSGAVVSMASDIQKNEETEMDGMTLAFLTLTGRQDAQNGDVEAVRRWVDGFN